MDKRFHSTFHIEGDYISVLGLKLIHVSKRGYCTHDFGQFRVDASVLENCGYNLNEKYLVSGTILGGYSIPNILHNIKTYVVHVSSFPRLFCLYNNKSSRLLRNKKGRKSFYLILIPIHQFQSGSMWLIIIVRIWFSIHWHCHNVNLCPHCVWMSIFVS